MCLVAWDGDLLPLAPSAEAREDKIFQAGYVFAVWYFDEMHLTLIVVNEELKGAPPP